MKVLKYCLMTEVNHGTEEQPDIQQIFSDVTLGWNESNEEIAKSEAYNGEYTIEEVPENLTPAQQRKRAYNTETIISWSGEMITVTQAAQLWAYYAAENNPKTEELQVLIAEAKGIIREKYPD